MKVGQNPLGFEKVCRNPLGYDKRFAGIHRALIKGFPESTALIKVCKLGLAYEGLQEFTGLYKGLQAICLAQENKRWLQAIRLAQKMVAYIRVYVNICIGEFCESFEYVLGEPW